MIADYDFYCNEYKGIVISDDKEYEFFAERASDELAPYAKKIVNAEDACIALKKCACDIADILYGNYKASKFGNKITSESVSGYYSVSYSGNDAASVNNRIQHSIYLYLRRYLLRNNGRMRIIL